MAPRDPDAASDLTDLEEEDDELVTDDEEEEPEPEAAPVPQTPPSNSQQERRKTRSQTAAETFVNNDTLKPPNTSNRALTYLCDEIRAGRLDLDPEYQRDVVWNEAKMTSLIDSLLKNYPIPPLIFAISFVNGVIFRTCIDGKQRLTSIKRFIDGEIPHKIMGKKFYYTKGSPNAKENKGKTPLSNADRSRFDSANISCVEFIDLSSHFEREIFQRVQLGVALTPAERLTALNTPCAELVRTLKSKLVEGLGETVKWNHSRGKDFNTVAQVVYLMNYPNATSEPTITKLANMLGSEEPITPTLQQDVSIVIDIFLFIAHHETHGDPLHCGRTLTAMELAMVLHLVNLYRNKFSMTQLSSAIGLFLQTNHTKKAKSASKLTPAQTCKAMLSFIKGLKNAQLGGGDANGDNVPAARVKLPPLQPKPRALADPPPTTTTKKAKSTKSKTSSSKITPDDTPTTPTPKAKSSAAKAKGDVEMKDVVRGKSRASASTSRSPAIPPPPPPAEREDVAMENADWAEQVKSAVGISKRKRAAAADDEGGVVGGDGDAVSREGKKARTVVKKPSSLPEKVPKSSSSKRSQADAMFIPKTKTKATVGEFQSRDPRKNAKPPKPGSQISPSTPPLPTRQARSAESMLPTPCPSRTPSTSQAQQTPTTLPSPLSLTFISTPAMSLEPSCLRKDSPSCSRPPSRPTSAASVSRSRQQTRSPITVSPVPDASLLFSPEVQVIERTVSGSAPASSSGGGFGGIDRLHSLRTVVALPMPGTSGSTGQAQQVQQQQHPTFSQQPLHDNRLPPAISRKPSSDTYAHPPHGLPSKPRRLSSETDKGLLAQPMGHHEREGGGGGVVRFTEMPQQQQRRNSGDNSNPNTIPIQPRNHSATSYSPLTTSSTSSRPPTAPRSFSNNDMAWRS